MEINSNEVGSDELCQILCLDNSQQSSNSINDQSNNQNDDDPMIIATNFNDNDDINSIRPSNEEFPTFFKIKSQKNKDMIVYNGYLYVVEKNCNETSYLKCAYKNDHNCKGRLIIRGDSFQEKNQHNHLVDVDLIGSRKLINEMKESAKTNPKSPTKCEQYKDPCRKEKIRHQSIILNF
ncbi:hypothetical protein BLA29_004754 [Euroglyphus maynei]|uniref:FLYWCH-type domain-containing protein n=1 Tax=Euroglyphus maynei TaxID=6958 RepID=A0A1Y3BBC7_EURMA|nr:hypothetical protein BLA29_004754 [Euroglyphus maynei]